MGRGGILHGHSSLVDLMGISQDVHLAPDPPPIHNKEGHLHVGCTGLEPSAAVETAHS